MAKNILLIVSLLFLVNSFNVCNGEDISIVELERLGSIPYIAAFTSLPQSGDMFWWFYPSTGAKSSNQPIIVWLDGVTGIPPSLLANFGMFGPYDFNLNKRENSWVDGYNLLFIDAPLGTGFSTIRDNSTRNLEENTDHLIKVLESFFNGNMLYAHSPLYICGEGHGAQLALSLAAKLADLTDFKHNLKGVVIGNGIVSPALAMSKLGFYLEELGYIDDAGRAAIEDLSSQTNTLVANGQLEEAFDNFIQLGEFVNYHAGAVAVNLGHITEKLTQEEHSTEPDYFGYRRYSQYISRLDNNIFDFMETVVAPALGISSDAKYDANREDVLGAYRTILMTPAVDKVEQLLQNTNVTVAIYNGNLDAVSNTPGQLEWIENLEWSGQTEFLNSPRQTLVVNRLIEGYFRETPRLQFYWMNAAGVSVPYDSPAAMRRVLDRITNSN